MKIALMNRARVEKVWENGNVNFYGRSWMCYDKPWDCVASSQLQTHKFRDKKILTRITSRSTVMASF